MMVDLEEEEGWATQDELENNDDDRYSIPLNNKTEYLLLWQWMIGNLTECTVSMNHDLFARDKTLKHIEPISLYSQCKHIIIT